MYDIVLKNQSGEKSVYKSVSELNVPKDGEGTAPFSARHLARVDVSANTAEVHCSESCAYGVDYIVSVNLYVTSAVTSFENAKVSISIGGETVSPILIKWNSDSADKNAVMCNTPDSRLLMIKVGGAMIVGDIVVTVIV